MAYLEHLLWDATPKEVKVEVVLYRGLAEVSYKTKGVEVVIIDKDVDSDYLPEDSASRFEPDEEVDRRAEFAGKEGEDAP